MGLPPGVTIADLLEGRNNTETLRQAHLLAVQSNNISDYIKRFDSVKIPEGCQSVVQGQLTKLKSVQTIIWNTMISMAVGQITIDDASLQTLLDKQAGDNIALMEMEKLATAITLDESTNWALDIEKIITEPPKTILQQPIISQPVKLIEPIYDEPEGMDITEITPILSSIMTNNKVQALEQ